MNDEPLRPEDEAAIADYLASLVPVPNAGDPPANDNTTDHPGDDPAF